MNQNTYPHDDEIDLIELFKTIWSKKTFIIIITAIITALAAVYANIKTPIYEVKSVIEIGHINNDLLEPAPALQQKLQLIYDPTNVDADEFKENGIVSKVTLLKAGNKFIEITTQALSNDIALAKNKQVLEYLQNEYQFKIDEFVQQTTFKIKEIERKINYANVIEKKQLEQEIDRIKSQVIPRIDKEIEFIENVELKAIDKKLELNQQKLEVYEAEELRLSQSNGNVGNNSSLLALQILNAQNLILNTQSNIENLNNQKQNTLMVKLTELEQKKVQVVTVDLKKTQTEINVELENKINDLTDNLEAEKLKITRSAIKNSELVSDYVVAEAPAKPKKLLIIAVAFMLGLFLSIFAALLMNFIKTQNNNNN